MIISIKTFFIFLRLGCLFLKKTRCLRWAINVSATMRRYVTALRCITSRVFNRVWFSNTIVSRVSVPFLKCIFILCFCYNIKDNIFKMTFLATYYSHITYYQPLGGGKVYDMKVSNVHAFCGAILTFGKVGWYFFLIILKFIYLSLK